MALTIECLGQSRHKLLNTPARKLIHLIIQNRSRNGYASLSYKELGDMIGVTDNQAVRVVQYLATNNLIETLRTTGGTGNKNQYRAIPII